jgi:ParB-like chromosome segregation protein Spo0J
MIVHYVNLLEVRRWPQNPREGWHDLQAICNSILAFGFNDPLVVDTITGFLVEGHGRLSALESLKAQGRQPPPHIIEENGDWFIPVIFEPVPEMGAYALAHNRLTETAVWDEKQLRALLSEQGRRGKEQLTATGFSGDDLDWLIRRAVERANQPPSDKPPVEQNGPQIIHEVILVFHPNEAIFTQYWEICEWLNESNPDIRLQQMLDIVGATA